MCITTKWSKWVLKMLCKHWQAGTGATLWHATVGSGHETKSTVLLCYDLITAMVIHFCFFVFEVIYQERHTKALFHGSVSLHIHAHAHTHTHVHTQHVQCTHKPSIVLHSLHTQRCTRSCCSLSIGNRPSMITYLCHICLSCMP